MDNNAPISGSPISSGRGKVSTSRDLSKSPITPSPTSDDFGGKVSQVSPFSARSKFLTNLQQLFGWRKKDIRKAPSKDNMEFIKVDAQSDMRIAQGKMGKVFKTKLVGKLEELFESWLDDTQGSYRTLLDREKRLNELEFALGNDPFLGMACDLYADEATQLDVQGNLIDIDCADIRQKKEMEDMLEQWGVTQNRLRSVAYGLAGYGDAFWSNKVTTKGVVRINPIGIHQVRERLEFNPVQVQTDINLQKGYVTAINRNQKLKALFDTIEGEENEEFADLFDTRLFGFSLEDDLAVPPWAITHFRLNVDQSEYFPMGRSFFLKALAPFRQCNATMVLQSLARVMSFPVTVFEVTTTAGMDENQQFEKINEVREQYEAIGDSGAGTEAYSVNTKIWAPSGLLKLTMLTPDVDINATNDIEMYQDRVAVASGVPKGYLVQEWGGYGNSAISLVEQFKPFARRVFTVQSAILEGLSNLFRLHFAITGKYDYRTPFVLSMKFPNEESSDARIAAKEASLSLSKDVLDTVANIVGAIDDPLPPEVIQDILTKFSFLDQKDIEKWVRKNPNQVEHQEETPEEFEGEGGLGGVGGGMPGPGGEEDFGEEPEGEAGGEENMPSAEGEEETGIENAPIPHDFEQALQASGPEDTGKREHYMSMEKKLRLQERRKSIVKRYKESEVMINEEVIRLYSRIDESTINNRHYKYSRVEPCMIATYQLFVKKENSTEDGQLTLREALIETKDEIKGIKNKLSWAAIRSGLDSESKKEDNTIENIDGGHDYPTKTQDEIRAKNINSLIS